MLTYALIDNAGGRFAIDANTGVITVADGTLLDFEAATSHGISVRVTDQGGLSFDRNFTIAVTNVNEAPTDEILTAARLPRIRLTARWSVLSAASILMRARC